MTRSVWKCERIIGIAVSKFGELDKWSDQRTKTNSIQNGPGQLWITKKLLNWPYSTENEFEELI